MPLASRGSSHRPARAGAIARLTALGSAVVVALAGCGGQTVVRTVTEQASPTKTESAAAPPEGEAELGDPLRLEGQETTVEVTATELLDPVEVGEFDTTDGRFVGVRLAIANEGGSTYTDAVANGTTLVLDGDEQVDPTLVSDGPCSGGFDSSVRIAPGDRRVGCVAFEVPSGQRARSVQFTPDSGFAGETAEWRLPRRAAGSAASDRAGVAPPPPSGGGTTACDANVRAGDGATCRFASNTFYEYYVAGSGLGLEVWSPGAGRYLDVVCSSEDGLVSCAAEDGGTIEFPVSAVDAYTQAAADSYAATAEVGP